MHTHVPHMRCVMQCNFDPDSGTPMDAFNLGAQQITVALLECRLDHSAWCVITANLYVLLVPKLIWIWLTHCLVPTTQYLVRYMHMNQYFST